MATNFDHMRILHTSDWHLGRSFHRVGMLDHQAGFIDHLLEVIEVEGVDVVVVAGDIYDRALPPVDAVRLADDTLVRLAGSRAKVVLSTGNHDSAQRLGFSSRLIDAAGIHIRSDAGRVAEPVLLDDSHGAVAIYAIPYLDPYAVAEPWGLTTRSHEAALSYAMRQVRSDLAKRPSTTRSVVLAHAFVAGAQPSESERDISVGGVSRVPTSVFEGVDYAALGHLHGAHVLTDQIRYSGSPLAYSFSEAGHRKGSWLVDFDATGLSRAEFIEAPVPRRLVRLRGTLDELLHDTRYASDEDAWVEVTLTDAQRPAQPMDRLRRRFPHALLLGFSQPVTLADGLPTAPREGRNDHQVADEFLRLVTGAPPTQAETALLYQAIDACCEDTDFDMLVGEG